MPDGRLRFEGGCANLRQTADWILSFGSRAEVLEPPELRGAVADEIRKMRPLYESV
jgi:predicted DNA-binding transcriptional regulator YafY